MAKSVKFPALDGHIVPPNDQEYIVVYIGMTTKSILHGSTSGQAEWVGTTNRAQFQ